MMTTMRVIVLVIVVHGDDDGRDADAGEHGDSE